MVVRRWSWIAAVSSTAFLLTVTTQFQQGFAFSPITVQADEVEEVDNADDEPSTNLADDGEVRESISKLKKLGAKVNRSGDGCHVELVGDGTSITTIGKSNSGMKFWSKKKLDRDGKADWLGTERDLALIGRLGRVKGLNIDRMEISDADMEQIGKLTNVEYIHFYMSSISNFGLSKIESLDKLRTLYISNVVNLTDDGFVSIPTLTSLSHLKISFVPIGDKGLSYIGKNAVITTLEIVQSRISDDGLKEISNLVGLENLILDEAEITDAGVASLTKLQFLKKLDLNKTKVTDDAVEILIKLQKLERIGLENNAITNKCAPFFQKLNLTSLGLSGTEIDDDAIPDLAKLHSLRFISLPKHVSRSGLIKLTEQLPNTVISYDFVRRTKSGESTIRYTFQGRVPELPDDDDEDEDSDEE